MSISEVDIANMALGWLGIPRIVNLADNDECFNNYPICRDACLEDVDWSFAIERFVLSTPVDVAPAFGYSYQYLLPTRVLRVIDVNDGEYPWVREGNRILTDQATCEVRAVVRVTDTRLFSSSFIQALAARLAATIAIPLTSSKSIAETWWGAYGVFKTAAQANDGRQGTTQQMRRRTPSKRYRL